MPRIYSRGARPDTAVSESALDGSPVVIVEVDLGGAAPEARLVDPEDFKAFKVVVADDEPSLGERVAGIGIARLDEHAWVSIEALRSLAGATATPAWEASLQSMLEYARSKGWVDDELGAIRGHVEHVP
jgi:hypothetical protein